VPSKALIHCAKVASLVRRAGEFGIDVPTPSIDFPRAMAYVRQVIETIGRHDSPERFRKLGVDVIQGQASFVDAETLQVGEQRLTSKQCVIATGSRSTIPPIEGLPEAGYLTHVEALNLAHQPRALVILGAGPIGIEFAQLFARLGTKVTVLEVVGQILPREDPEVAHALEGYLRAEGVEIYTCTRAFKVDVQQGVKVVHGNCDVQGAGKGEVTFTADTLLVATGRAPNVEGLGLERVGVETTEKGIVVDDHLRTTAKHVWACGDVTGKYLFTHVAEYQARLLVGNALFPLRRKADYRVVPWTTFSDPEVARVGLTEPEARDQYGDKVRVYRHAFGEVDRAVAEGEPSGFVKLVCDAKGQLLGAHVLGPRGGDLLQPLVLAMREKIPITRLSQTIHAYPTLVEANRRAADQYYLGKLFSGTTGRLLRAWVRWFS
jgi:pyruvate/2-oxoglutarate dehydrogenase complex dihydrolipoamide dehydrogenase (E3) component